MILRHYIKKQGLGKQMEVSMQDREMILYIFKSELQISQVTSQGKK